MPDAFDHFFGLFGKRTEDLLDLVELTPAYRLFPENAEPVDVISGREEAIALFDALSPGSKPRPGRLPGFCPRHLRDGGRALPVHHV